MVKTFTRILSLLLFLVTLRSTAQDIHFSQFYVTHWMQNPAFTGFFDGSYRFTGIARSQWGSVSVPYRTFAASMDKNFKSGGGHNDLFGAGMNVTTDRAGDSHFTTTRIEGNIAYHKVLDRFQRHYLSSGLQVAYTSASVDYKSLTFDENYEHGIATENTSNVSTHYADASLGMEYSCLASKKENFTLGAAVFHVNQPQQTFFADARSVVYRKYVFNAGGTWAASEHLRVFPKINYSRQGTSSELNFGAFGRYDFTHTPSKEYGIYMGLLHRLNDAVIFVTRFDLQDVAMTFSYDINYSKLARVSHGLGGPELSVQYIGAGKHKASKRVYCPIF